jgi:hypothetical protein
MPTTKYFVDPAAPSTTVRAHQKISGSSSGFDDLLEVGTHFGRNIAVLNDLNNDGVDDLAVGTFGGGHSDSVFILFLDETGTAESFQKILPPHEGGSSANFTGSVASMGDLDGDGVTDLAVGAQVLGIADNHGNAAQGAVWILFLTMDGMVKASQLFTSDSFNPFEGIVGFGTALASIQILNHPSPHEVGEFPEEFREEFPQEYPQEFHEEFSEEFPEEFPEDFGMEPLALVVGAPLNEDGSNQGAVYILFFEMGGAVMDTQVLTIILADFPLPT